MSAQHSLFRKFFLFVYVAFWSVLLGAAAYGLTRYLISTLNDSFAQARNQAAKPDVFDSVVALTEKKVTHYLGPWEMEEPKLPGHFHHVGHWYQPDQTNFCIKCHGAIPHSRNPQIRAFLNMHNLFISCQVCHAREDKDVALDRFGWLDIKTGQLCPSPDMTQGLWGEYGAKIVPLIGPVDHPDPLRLSEEAAFAEEFRQNMDTLNDSQKVTGNKFIHRRCTDHPVRCVDCHNTKKAFLPYTELGYSTERTEFLISDEVADLVVRYETFHLPNLLKTQGSTEPKSDEDGQ